MDQKIHRMAMTEEQAKQLLAAKRTFFVSTRSNGNIERIFVATLALVFIGVGLASGFSSFREGTLSFGGGLALVAFLGFGVWRGRLVWDKPPTLFAGTEQGIFVFRGAELFFFPWACFKTAEYSEADEGFKRFMKRNRYVTLALRPEVESPEMKWASTLLFPVTDDAKKLNGLINERVQAFSNEKVSSAQELTVFEEHNKKGPMVAFVICAIIVVVETASFFVPIPGLIESSRTPALVICGLAALANLGKLRASRRPLFALQTPGIQIMAASGFKSFPLIPWREVKEVYVESIPGDDSSTSVFTFVLRDASKYEAALGTLARLVSKQRLLENKIQIAYEKTLPEPSNVVLSCKAFMSSQPQGVA